MVPHPKDKHPVGTKPFDDAVERIGYCAVVVLGVKADMISIGAELFVVFWSGNDVPIFEYPSPSPDRD